MFDTLSNQTKGMKTMSVAASMTLQTTIATAIIGVSIWRVQTLTPPPLNLPVQFMMPKPPHVKLVDLPRNLPKYGRTVSAFVADVLRAPTKVPPRAVQIFDDAPLATAAIGQALLSDAAPCPACAAANVLSGPEAPVKPAAAPSTAPGFGEKTNKPVRVGGKVLEAQIINRVLPVYPALAKQMRLSGVVQLIGIIGKDGHVQNLQLVSGHPLLVKAALDAVRQWTYRPTMLNGEPVEVTAPIEVRFALTQ